MKKVQLNCDLGEGMSYDKQLMPLIDSCSIACGGHFGDEKSMEETMLLARDNNVKIGAHPSFPDRKNFGRKPLILTELATDRAISKIKLQDSLKSQIDSFLSLAARKGFMVDHIKAHGALYNMMIKDVLYAEMFMEVIVSFDIDIKIYTPWHSVMVALASQAKRLIQIEKEAFADRRYDEDGNLISRTEKGALILEKEASWRQVVSILKNQKVETIRGKYIYFEADTFCVHGDNLQAVEIVKHLRFMESKRSNNPII